ncbi:MAG: chromosomal replication initiator protein DnaA [Bacilli bacterium]|nr:chromosomal replication initiator protein DnaA [Bacilli bacterium]
MKSQVEEIVHLWERILNEVRVRLGDDRIFNSFLSDSEIKNINNNVISVVVNSRLAKQVLSSKEYYDLITSTIQDILESNYQVTFLLKDEIIKEEKMESGLIPLFSESKLKNDMTFDNFVVGDSNKEAYQAALLVASNKNKLWNPNPIFLYSASGLGKTHLLNAIGNAIKENSPNKRVLYTTAEEFFNEFVHILKHDRVEQQMLDYFRNIDVLLIDDIQFFGGKKECEKLFFTVFSSLINSDRQVVVTSDKHPNELKGMENRLISRFSGGLDIAINPPDLNTSIEIIKLYVTASGMDITRIDQDVFPFFAEKFSKNIRELRGAINKLLFYTINIKKVDHITLANAIEAVGDYLKVSESNKKLNEIKIIDVVSNYYSLTPTQLTGNMRTGQIAAARHIAMFLIRDILDTPFDGIGKIFGGKDHSTVMSACKNVEKGLKTNPSLQTVINEIRSQLKL